MIKADDVDRQLHQCDVADVGRDVAEHPRRRARRDGLGGAHVVARRVLDELGAHQAIDAGPARQAEDQHNALHAAPGDRREAKISRMPGIAVNTLYSHSSASPTLPPGTRRGAESTVPMKVASSAEHADEDRDLRPLDRLGKHVAPEAVGAEGSVARRGASGAAVRRSPRPTPGSAASGSTSLRSTRGPVGAAMADVGLLLAGPMKVGGALGSAISLPVASHEAERGQRDQQQEGADDRERDDADRSLRSRFHAAAQTPGWCWGCAAGSGRTALTSVVPPRIARPAPLGDARACQDRQPPSFHPVPASVPSPTGCPPTPCPRARAPAGLSPVTAVPWRHRRMPAKAARRRLRVHLNTTPGSAKVPSVARFRAS